VDALRHDRGAALERRRLPAQPHDRVVFTFADGWLSYRNQRKLGGIWIARGEGAVERVTGRLGPDALAVSRGEFAGLLARRRGGLKAALMDQKLIAGLGNLLSDEILWHAKLNPRAQVAALSRAEVDRLYESMRSVLRESNRHARVPRKKDWLTGVRDDAGARCPRCGTLLKRARIAGRTACWCPRDQ
jgi:formamidopyrimidine-DNA glycosylase